MKLTASLTGAERVREQFARIAQAPRQALNQITFISGSRTDTRYIRLVQLSASPSLPA